MLHSRQPLKVEESILEDDSRRTKKKRGEFDLVNQIREGKIPVSAFSKVCEILHLTKKDLAKAIDVKERTLSRREHGAFLQKNEADKLLRLVRILDFAIEVLEDKDQGIEWLKSPKIALNNMTPISLLDTDSGAKHVEELLGRIEYGVYT